MNLKVEFKNYKKLKDVSAEFNSGNIYVVKASNDKGKTSFLQGIKSLITGEKKGKDLVSHNETDGSIIGKFKGADNKIYTVKMDIDSSDKTKFTLIDPETNIHKSTSRTNVISDIFKYNLFTIDEWFAWGLTAEGRRKQADIMLNLLPKKDKEEYLDIDSKVSKDGELYLKRAEANSNYISSKKILDNSKPTEEELEKLSNLQTAKEKLKKYISDKERIKSSIDSQEEDISTLNDYENQLSEIPDFIKLKEESYSASCIKRDTRIKELEKMIEDLKAEGKEAEERYQEDIKDFKDSSKKLESNIRILKEKCSKETYNENVKNLKEIEERISKGEEYINSCESIYHRNKMYEESLSKIHSLKEEADNLDEKINKLRERKVEIITNAKLPVENIVISDGECFYDDNGSLIPFTEESVSYAKGGVIVAKLMANINKEMPIYLIGKAESYDNNSLKELNKIVEENNGIMILDEVDREDSELKIECLIKK